MDYINEYGEVIKIPVRCNANAEARKVAQKAENNTLLAGIVYCAHCGARMSGFMHMDRYKLKNGKVVEALKPKYNCFQRAQHLRKCDGQALYLADRVDAVVLNVARELFGSIQRSPRDRMMEEKIRQEYKEKQKQNRANYNAAGIYAELATRRHRPYKIQFE